MINKPHLISTYTYPFYRNYIMSLFKIYRRYSIIFYIYIINIILIIKGEALLLNFIKHLCILLLNQIY